jgi:hypothetical protein
MLSILKIMKKFNIIGSPFSHAHTSTWWKKSNVLEWDYGGTSNDTTFYVDYGLNEIDSQKRDGKKYGWLLESNSMLGGLIDDIKKNPNQYLDKLDFIFTCDGELLSMDNRFKWSPGYGVSVEVYGGNEKNRIISMITSDKRMTEQQRFRVDFANKNRGIMDLYGRGYKPIDNKNIGLDNYMFSVAIENAIYDTYFTEKVLDCFATKTIPLYMGSRGITKFFNEKGIIFLEDINYNIININERDYIERLEYIEDNFNRVKEYDILDDWIYKTYIENE